MWKTNSEEIDSDIHHFHIRYFSQLVLYQILTLLQMILIISTIYTFHQKTTDSNLSGDKLRIYNGLKTLFILVLTMGSLVFFLVEWYGIADFLYDFAALPQYCDIAAILGNIFLTTYLLTLYLFYLYRLWATFQNSAFRLSHTTIKALLSVTFVTYFTMIALILIFEDGVIKRTLFSWTLRPLRQSEYKQIVICEGEFSIGIHPELRIALQCIVIIGNTFYGCIFYKKLYDLLQFMCDVHLDDLDTKHSASGKEDSSVIELESERAVYQLMIKQTTLVMISTVSTSILWSIANVLHYFGSFWQILIYLDITINCLCIFLMFSWNDGLYKTLCKPCAKMTDFCCSKAFKSDQLQAIRKSISKPDISTEKNGKRSSVSLHIHGYSESAQFKNSNFNITPLSTSSPVVIKETEAQSVAEIEGD